MTIPFQFDEERHIYTVDGMVVPGVTRIIDHAGLTDFANVRADILERRSKLGRIVHSCAHFFDEGDLDWPTVAEEARGYVDSWANLVTELGLKWNHIEHQCVSEIDGMKLGMRPDREGFVLGRLSVVDLKISRQAEPWHGIQTALYAMGLPHPMLLTPMARFMARDRYIAKLHEHGKKAQLVPYRARNDADVGRSALAISHWKLAHGRKIESLELEEAA